MDQIILGSRSPQRQWLLKSVVAPECIEIVPPLNSEEPGFEDCRNDLDIDSRLREIVAAKHADIVSQLQSRPGNRSASASVAPAADTAVADAKRRGGRTVIVVADTTVVVTNNQGHRQVLGQPGPENWADESRHWLTNYLSGCTHSVRTCFRVTGEEAAIEDIVSSSVTFASLSPEMVEWYLATDEPRGKAGGYAIQGFGAALVTGLEGCLTNVIGLPLKSVCEALARLSFPTLMFPMPRRSPDGAV